MRKNSLVDSISEEALEIVVSSDGASRQVSCSEDVRIGYKQKQHGNGTLMVATRHGIELNKCFSHACEMLPAFVEFRPDFAPFDTISKPSENTHGDWCIKTATVYYSIQTNWLEAVGRTLSLYERNAQNGINNG